MAKEFFEDQKLNSTSLRRIETVNEIVDEYAEQGFQLTLRQLYYQLVARDIIPNKQNHYDNLGKLVNKGRLQGLIDWDAIEDRTRFLRGNVTQRSPATAIARARRNYKIEMWEGQDTKVEVWIEKDALVGVIDGVCREQDVDFFACRGYVSASEMYTAAKRYVDYMETYERVVILHLGDHDPSGIDMTRDIRDRLQLLSGYENIDVERIALNMPQIEEMRPPPNPAKLSDSRANTYVDQYGYSSWELDAIPPQRLADLVSDEIDTYKDWDIWRERKEQLRKDREKLDLAVQHVRTL